jgi:hypothetical protein
MHRTQIYFDEPLFEALKREASTLGLSLSAYIREALKKDLEMRKREKKSPDFSDFSGMWKERDIDQKSLREKAWK